METVILLPPAPRPARRVVLAEGYAASYIALGPKSSEYATVFLHGFGGNLLSWQANLTAIAGTRSIAIDLPGHGGSDLPLNLRDISDYAAWLMAVLDALDVKRAHIVAHSLGGWIALETARQHSDRVAGLSLIASAGLHRNLDILRLLKILDVTNPVAQTDAVEWLLSGSSVDLPLVARALLRQMESDVVRRCLQHILDETIVPAFDPSLPALDWSDLDMPMQVLCGAGDAVIAPPHGDGDFNAGGQLYFIPDAGHMVHLQQPEYVNRLLQEFASRLK